MTNKNFKVLLTLLLTLLLALKISLCQCQDERCNWGGTYKYGSSPMDGPMGLIHIYPLNDSIMLFHLDVTRGKPSYNSGELVGRIKKREAGIWYYSKQSAWFNCALRFIFEKDSVVINTDSAACKCGYGYGVRSDGSYKLLNDSTPTIFIDRHGDKITFESLIND